jgi:plasmid stabilization system protein ParE
MIYSVIVEPEALQDLYNIKKYIAEQDTTNKANQFISELKANIKTLTQMPERCRKSYYSSEPNTHDLIYKKYTTVFQIVRPLHSNFHTIQPILGT